MPNSNQILDDLEPYEEEEQELDTPVPFNNPSVKHKKSYLPIIKKSLFALSNSTYKPKKTHFLVMECILISGTLLVPVLLLLSIMYFGAASVGIIVGIIAFLFVYTFLVWADIVLARQWHHAFSKYEQHSDKAFLQEFRNNAMTDKHSSTRENLFVRVIITKGLSVLYSVFFIGIGYDVLWRAKP